MAVCGMLVNVNNNAIEYVIGPVTEFFIGIPVRSTSVYDSNHSNLGWRWVHGIIWIGKQKIAFILGQGGM